MAGRRNSPTDQHGPPTNDGRPPHSPDSSPASASSTPRRTPLDRLTDQLAELPGIGRKTAEKLAYHLLRASVEEARALADAIVDMKEHMRACSVCFNLTEADPCAICTSPNRDRTRVCVVEQPRDLLAIERTGTFDGLYHVLTGRVSLLDGERAEHLTLGPLRERIRSSAAAAATGDGGAENVISEVILATNPDFEGDGTALHVREALQDLPVTITQLARGIPQGASIEFVSTAILSDALRGRRASSAPTATGSGS